MVIKYPEWTQRFCQRCKWRFVKI